MNPKSSQAHAKQVALKILGVLLVILVGIWLYSTSTPVNLFITP